MNDEKCPCLKRVGGPSFGKNKCPECGKVFNRYFGGLICDLEFLRGKVESLEWGLEFWKNQAAGKKSSEY